MKNIKTIILALVFGWGAVIPGGPILAASTDASSRFILPEYSKKVSLDFKGADIRDVLKAFSQQIGANFLVTKGVDVPSLSVFLQEVPVEDALSRILDANGLTYQYDPLVNIFTVMPKAKGPDETMATRVFQLKFASVKDSSLNKALAEGLVKNLAMDAGTAGAAGTTEAAEGGSGVKAVVESFLLDQEKGKVVEDPRTNSLIVTDLQSNFPTIEMVLARLDVPVPQVLIEVEMLDVAKGVVDDIGFKYDGTLLSLDPEGTGALSQTGKSNGWTRYADVFRLWEHGDLSTAMGMALNFIRTDERTKSLARPRIMTLDHQAANIRISKDEVIGFDVTRNDDGSVEDVTAERYETGVILTVTPQVSLLTDEITLVVEPKLIEALEEITINLGGGAGEQTFKNPEERGVKSILKVKNGETIVIGGLLRTEESEIVTKLPLLGDIPALGALFRHKSKSVSDRELLIVLTPKIMDRVSGGARIQGGVVPVSGAREQTALDSRQAVITRELEQTGLR